MIDNYCLPKMKKIWSESTKYNYMLKVELAAIKAHADLGVVSKEELNLLKKNAKYDLKKINANKESTKDEVLSFINAVCENYGKEKRWFHYGIANNDLLENARALQIKQSNIIIEEDICKLLNVLKANAIKYKKSYCVARTNGFHQEVTTFGLKWLGWYDELKRIYQRFLNEIIYVEVIKLSGNVGNYSDINPKVEEIVANELKLGLQNISSYMTSRDRFSGYINVLNSISNLLEKIASEIKNLSSYEIGEVKEFQEKLVKNITLYPHKTKAVNSENICGLSKLMKGFSETSIQYNLTNEGDYSIYLAEGEVLSSILCLIDYMVESFCPVLDKLIVDEQKMMKNIKLTKGIIFANQVLNVLIEKGLTRENASIILQQLAYQAFEQKIDYQTLLLNSKVGNLLTKEELDKCFNINNALKNIDFIYDRVLNN